MSIGVLHGQNGGGIKLPFRVIGGTTQPSNPKDGDIWVKTSVPIMRTEFANGTWASGGVGLVFLAGTLGGSNPTGTNTTVWAINKNTGTDKYILKLTLTGCKQVQGSKGNWVSLDAYRYYGGTWVQFSTAFTATINITYPAGSTCTVTDGTTTITAPDTSGTWACAVPNAGTWTITAMKGSQSKSTNVSITTNGQSISVTLSYLVVLFNGTSFDDELTGGWNKSNSNCTVSGGYLHIYGKGNITSKNKVDLSPYTSIKFTISNFSSDNSAKTDSGIDISNVNDQSSYVAYYAVKKNGTYSLDVSSLNGSYYIDFYCDGYTDMDITYCELVR